MNNQYKPPKGIAIVILLLWALLCLRCEEEDECNPYENELRCASCGPEDPFTNCLEHCVDASWEVLIDCKEMIHEDAQCIDQYLMEARCVFTGK